MIKIFKKTKHGIKIIRLCEKGLELYQSEKWTTCKDGYLFYLQRLHKLSLTKTKTLRFHRELLELKDNALKVDHINGDGLDNRLCNLRTVTVQQNNMNRRKHKKGSSIYKGVCWVAKRNQWYANIDINRKTTWLGSFKTEKEAALAYNKKALELFGEYAHLNIIE